MTFKKCFKKVKLKVKLENISLIFTYVKVFIQKNR